ncbi:hypothetical protein GCM10010393_34610 [Streptomyces gobitricini]|uniref:Uncharacterized protein n=1 Tax=Streptomyces gobitricini TaxID=68211 RepID=A0ABP5ZMB6_9ACTN
MAVAVAVAVAPTVPARRGQRAGGGRPSVGPRRGGGAWGDGTAVSRPVEHGGDAGQVRCPDAGRSAAGCRTRPQWGGLRRPGVLRRWDGPRATAGDGGRTASGGQASFSSSTTYRTTSAEECRASRDAVRATRMRFEP